jgi:phosphatidate cytidylyltransferase
MKKLILRAVTGSVYIAVILGGIYLPGIACPLVFGVMAAALLWEFLGLTGDYDDAPLRRGLHAAAAAYLFFAVFAWTHDWSSANIFLPYLFFLLYVIVVELFGQKANPLRNWSVSIFAQLYCAGMLSLLGFFSEPWGMMILFVTVWVNDTGAYLIGSWIGRRQLFPSVSPKKSWEGFWGGCLAATIMLQIFAGYHPELNRFEWLGLSLVIVVAATLGDLVESLLKRTFSVKDSGHALPGHGGFLDRFDSTLLAIPAAYIYLELIL